MSGVDHQDRRGSVRLPESASQGRHTAVGSSSSSIIIETIVSPFHCLYQDALEFHQQSKLRAGVSAAESSRLARAALVLYLASAEALIHQAAAELGRPELAHLVCDPRRPMALEDVWRLLPTLSGELVPGGLDEPDTPPWPQFHELLTLRAAWAYPGGAVERRAYYRREADGEGGFEPLQPHEVPTTGVRIPVEQLVYPRTGLPRDPYALRAGHLDTVRSILDAAITALDRSLDGQLTREGRHRREPVRVVAGPTAEVVGSGARRLT